MLKTGSVDIPALRHKCFLTWIPSESESRCVGFSPVHLRWTPRRWLWHSPATHLPESSLLNTFAIRGRRLIPQSGHCWGEWPDQASGNSCSAQSCI